MNNFFRLRKEQKLGVTKMSERILSLEEIKQVELDILEYLHEICEKHDIKYFIDFGTLLGAVRHQGFIPWDDDTDISLARDEFEKLYKVLKNENHPYYKMISFRETKGYPYSYMRVYDIRTRRDANLRDSTVVLGTCVDVFPYDGVATEKSDRKKMKLYQYLIRLSSLNFKGIKSENGGLKNLPRYIGSAIFQLSSPQTWNQKLENMALKYSLDQAKYLACTIFDPSLPEGIKKEWLYDLIDLPYENIVVKAPRKYHEILVYEFGENYMTPPPIEQQVPGGDKNYWID